MVGKGVKYFLVFLIAVIPFASQLVPPEISEMNLLDFLGYLSPVLKSVTVGGVIVMILNYLKVKKGVSVLG